MKQILLLIGIILFFMPMVSGNLETCQYKNTTYTYTFEINDTD